jgi:CxxC motif-containing protein (DUF1111 family)
VPVPPDDDPPDQNLGTDLRSDQGPGRVPVALGDKVIHPYSDFMLHDIGTGDGIVQTQFAQNPPRGSEQLFRTKLIGGVQVNEFTQALSAFVRAVNRLRGVPEHSYGMIYVDRSDVRAGQRPAADNVPRRLTEKDMNGNNSPLNQRTRNRVRTATLWGLRVRPQLLHDGSAISISEAIGRHQGEAAEVEARFEALTEKQKRQLLAFLNSLGFDNRPGDGPPHP